MRSDYYTRLSSATAPITANEPVYSTTDYNYTGTAYIDNKEYQIIKYATSGTYAEMRPINRIHNSEGYIDNIYTPLYYYFRRDHLGNNREVWLANTDSTVQRTQYYPSGLPWKTNTDDNPGVQPYKYNGKEFIEMHGLDTYDYGARGYYAAIGRWTNIDPMVEKYYNISPYVYCSGNSTNRMDLDGMDWFQNTQTGAIVYVSALHEGAEKGMESGWEWMGANDMFQKNKGDIANSDNILVAKNGGNFEIKENNPLTHNDDERVTSLYLNGSRATKFMSDRGYEFKPTQQIRYEFEINFDQESGTHITTGEKTYITEKSAYIPKGSIENKITPMNAAYYKIPAYVNRFKIEYTNNTFVKVLNILMPYIGYHDMRTTTVYPSLKAYTQNNQLINKFLRLNPMPQRNEN